VTCGVGVALLVEVDLTEMKVHDGVFGRQLHCLLEMNLGVFKLTHRQLVNREVLQRGVEAGVYLKSLLELSIGFPPVSGTHQRDAQQVTRFQVARRDRQDLVKQRNGGLGVPLPHVGSRRRVVRLSLRPHRMRKA
jgi:hypothetical protein